MTACVLHKKGIRGNVCFPGMAVTRKKFILTLPSPVYWTMVRTGNFCNISPFRQMPSQVTLFFITLKIDCNIDLRTRNICRKSQVTCGLSANPSPSGPWTGWRIHEGDFARCSKNMLCVSTSYLVFVSPWLKCVPQYFSLLTCRLKLSWFSLNLNCIWTGVPPVRCQQYKGCKSAGLSTQGSRRMCGYTSIWNKTYCRERLSLGMYGLYVKSRTFITPHTFCVLYRLLEIHGEELVFFFKLSPPTEKWSMTVCILHEKVIRGNVCFPGMALSRKKFIPTLPSPVYWTMVGTSNFCNISPSRQMPSQVTLFFINIRLTVASTWGLGIFAKRAKLSFVFLRTRH